MLNHTSILNRIFLYYFINNTYFLTFRIKININFTYTKHEPIDVIFNDSTLIFHNSTQYIYSSQWLDYSIDRKSFTLHNSIINFAKTFNSRILHKVGTSNSNFMGSSISHGAFARMIYGSSRKRTPWHFRISTIKNVICN